MNSTMTHYSITNNQLQGICIVIACIIHAILLFLLFTFMVSHIQHLSSAEIFTPPVSMDDFTTLMAPPTPDTSAPDSLSSMDINDTSLDASPENLLAPSPIAESMPNDIPSERAVTESVSAESNVTALSATSLLPDQTSTVTPPAPARRIRRIKQRGYTADHSINGTSLAHMTHQFASSIAHEQAKKHKTVAQITQDTFKYTSYINSIYQFLYGNFNPRNQELSLTHAVHIPMDVTVSIDTNGRCRKVTLAHTSGDTTLDHFIIHHLTHAGPYPPLPRHFATNVWNFKLSLMINCPAGKGVPKIVRH